MAVNAVWWRRRDVTRQRLPIGLETVSFTKHPSADTRQFRPCFVIPNIRIALVADIVLAPKMFIGLTESAQRSHRPTFSTMMRSLLVAALALLAAPQITAFGVQPAPIIRTTTSSTSLDLFGGLKDAFKNDESLGTRENAGLKNGPKFNDQVTVNGQPVQGAVAGQKLTVVASKARVRIPVNCQKGDCGTCMVKLNGRQVKGECLLWRQEATGTTNDALTLILNVTQLAKLPCPRAKPTLLPCK